MAQIFRALDLEWMDTYASRYIWLAVSGPFVCVTHLQLLAAAAAAAPARRLACYCCLCWCLLFSSPHVSVNLWCLQASEILFVSSPPKKHVYVKANLPKQMEDVASPLHVYAEFFKDKGHRNGLFRTSTTKIWCSYCQTRVQSVLWHYKRDVLL